MKDEWHSGQIVYSVVFIFHEPLSSADYIVPSMGFLEFHDAFLSLLNSLTSQTKTSAWGDNVQKRKVTALETLEFLTRDLILEQKQS